MALCTYALITIIAITYIYFTWIFTYWKRKKVPYLGLRDTLSFICTNFLLKQKYLGLYLQQRYNYMRNQGHQHGGSYLFNKPLYMPIDLKIIKGILQEDFETFNERNFYHNEKDDPLSANLFALGGTKWKNLRSHLSPAFTAGKLKMMFDDILQNGYQLCDAIKDKSEIDVKDMSVCYSINVIGSCIFGLNCNTFNNPEDEFKKQGLKVFDFSSTIRRLTVVIATAYANFARAIGLTYFDKETNTFFSRIVSDTVQFRKNHGVKRKDMIELLMNLKNENGKGLTLNELTAQAFIFFSAGFETSSKTLSFCLYELAENLVIQKKVRSEINNVLAKYRGDICYDAIMEMKFMQNVLDETMRKYPPVSFLTRKSVKDYRVPNMDIILDKGTELYISILGLHRDPDYFPDPEKFEPDRFSDENKNQILPFSYLPFGEGPRVCIGMRFGIITLKVALTVLLMKYKFLVSNKTEIPIEFEPFSFTLLPRSNILLDVQKI